MNKKLTSKTGFFSYSITKGHQRNRIINLESTNWSLAKDILYLDLFNLTKSEAATGGVL